MYIQPNVRMGRSVLVLQAKTAVGRVRLGRLRPPDRGGPSARRLPAWWSACSVGHFGWAEAGEQDEGRKEVRKSA